MGCDSQFDQFDQFDRGDEHEYEVRREKTEKKRIELWDNLHPIPLSKLTVYDLRMLVSVMTPSQYHTWGEDDNEALEDILRSAGER